MTELKDEIKKIILAAEEGCECQQRPCGVCANGIAQRIADSLVVDEERVFEVVQAHMNIIDPNENYSDCTDDRNLAKDISEAKPIKCEVVE